MVIDGIQIHNRFIKNIFKGTMLPDEGLWSNGTALILNQIHGLCRKHKASGISNSTTELVGHLANDFISDMNKII